jgi:signal transduction histidine kinase
MVTGHRRTYVLFGLLTVYIILQFIWWAVLLVRKDDLISTLIAQVEALGGTATSVGVAGRSKLMIVGEGIVFLVIVLVVLYLTFRAIRRDLSLARDQQNFLLAVTHELRTPIAGIKLQLQTLGRRDLSAEVRDTLRLKAVQEADRLAQLTEKVLITTTFEQPRAEPLLQEIELMTFMRTLVDRAQQQIAPAHTVILEGPGDLQVNTDPEALRTIVDNLVENAVKYAPEGTNIQVEVIAKKEGWRLTVCDEGPGIPMEDRERIFEKFYRSGNEGTRSAKGTGLGLYIVKRLVQQLGGGITVKDRRPHGSIFAASFPYGR